MNALWGSFEYELQDGAICRMGFFSYYDAGGPGEAFTVRRQTAGRGIEGKELP